MAWEEELEELQRRRERALEMGGPDQVQRQHDHGKLTARERVELLVDSGTFREFGILAGQATYDGDRLTAFTPKGEVNGMCRIDGRTAVVTAGDFTVRGGAATSAHGGIGAELRPSERALAWRVPYVRLLDASGGSVASFETLGRTYLPDGNAWTRTEVELMDHVPVVSAVLGSVAGLPAVDACLAHFNVMVRGTAQLFPGGPPVVKAALGMDIDKETLGGAHVHTTGNGVVDNVAGTEQEALEQVRRFLSYLPSSVEEEAPHLVPARPPGLGAETLRSVVPANRRQPFDVRRLLAAVLDDGSLFEIAPGYGPSRVTGLARVDGYAIGVMANDPRRLGGATDAAAGDKVIRLIQLCDQFHLPIVSFADEPGFLVGPQAEKAGIERAGARLVWTVCRSRIPWMTVVVGRLYGVAGQCHHRSTGMFRRYAWPSARWGSMHISGGASAAYRRVIEQAEDPEARRKEIEQRLEAIASPFRTAEATGQDIIDPADTRELLVEFVHDAQRVLRTQLGPPALAYRP